MIFKRSCPSGLSDFGILYSLHCASLFHQIPPWPRQYESTLPAVESVYNNISSSIRNVEHLYQTMHYQIIQPDTTLVIQNVQCFASLQNQQKSGPSGNNQLPSPKRHISPPAGARDSFQGGSSVPSSNQGQNCTTSSSLNNSRIAKITQQATANIYSNCHAGYM